MIKELSFDHLILEYEFLSILNICTTSIFK